MCSSGGYPRTSLSNAAFNDLFSVHPLGGGMGSERPNYNPSADGEVTKKTEPQ